MFVCPVALIVILLHHKGPGTCSHCNMAVGKKINDNHKNIEPQELCSFIATEGSNNVLLLDVRTPAEFDGKPKINLAD